MLDQRRMAVISDSARLAGAMKYVCSQNRYRLSQSASKLDALSPLAVFSRGYAAVFSENGALVRKTGDICVGDKITVRTTDGQIYADVTGKELVNNG